MSASIRLREWLTIFRVIGLSTTCSFSSVASASVAQLIQATDFASAAKAVVISRNVRMPATSCR